MNQILVTQKLYITPELYRKKKAYKFQFFLSVLLVCLLSSYYIYAEYDRNKSEEVSQEILQGIEFVETEATATTTTTTVEDTTVKEYDGMIVVAIEEDEEETQANIQENVQANITEYELPNGITATPEAVLNIPRLGINYPVLSEWSEELLKISLNKYWGPNPNEIGNYCIVGHNYKSGKMFGRLPEIANGDIIELKDMTGRTIKYSVYDRYVVSPTDTACTTQRTGGKKELTLITCKSYGQQRLVVKAREIK